MKGHIIALDAMGGDNAPDAIVSGGVMALRRYPDISLLLAGPEPTLNQLLAGADDVRDRIEILPAEDTISMDEPPMLAVRRKVNSSLVQAMLAVREGRAQAIVSAGSTGAVLAGGMLRIGRIPGIERPALAPILPGAKKPFLLIDCGANVDCKPDYLVQFGLMGEVYMQGVMGVDKPRVGLINIGAEEEKGNALVKAAYPMMREAPYQFVGNVEARDLLADTADVLVCDGFSGNLVLKFMEGVASTLMGIIKGELMADTRSKIGALIAKPAFQRVKHAMDYSEVGGAPLLGVQGSVVKAHGSSNGHAMACAIAQCVKMIRADVPATIARGVEKLLPTENA